jgi:hypothetical protein
VTPAFRGAFINDLPRGVSLMEGLLHHDGAGLCRVLRFVSSCRAVSCGGACAMTDIACCVVLCCVARTTAIFKVNYQSHLAMRVLLPLRSFEVREKMDLYEQVPVACVVACVAATPPSSLTSVCRVMSCTCVRACRVVCAHNRSRAWIGVRTFLRVARLP